MNCESFVASLLSVHNRLGCHIPIGIYLLFYFFVNCFFKKNENAAAIRSPVSALADLLHRLETGLSTITTTGIFSFLFNICVVLSRAGVVMAVIPLAVRRELVPRLIELFLTLFVCLFFFDCVLIIRGKFR